MYQFRQDFGATGEIGPSVTPAWTANLPATSVPIPSRWRGRVFSDFRPAPLLSHSFPLEPETTRSTTSGAVVDTPTTTLTKPFDCVWRDFGSQWKASSAALVRSSFSITHAAYSWVEQSDGSHDLFYDPSLDTSDDDLTPAEPFKVDLSPPPLTPSPLSEPSLFPSASRPRDLLDPVDSPSVSSSSFSFDFKMTEETQEKLEQDRIPESISFLEDGVLVPLESWTPAYLQETTPEVDLSGFSFDFGSGSDVASVGENDNEDDVSNESTVRAPRPVMMISSVEGFVLPTYGFYEPPNPIRGLPSLLLYKGRVIWDFEARLSRCTWYYNAASHEFSEYLVVCSQDPSVTDYDLVYRGNTINMDSLGLGEELWTIGDLVGDTGCMVLLFRTFGSTWRHQSYLSGFESVDPDQITRFVGLVVGSDIIQPGSEGVEWGFVGRLMESWTQDEEVGRFSGEDAMKLVMNRAEKKDIYDGDGDVKRFSEPFQRFIVFLFCAVRFEEKSAILSMLSFDVFENCILPHLTETDHILSIYPSLHPYLEIAEGGKKVEIPEIVPEEMSLVMKDEKRRITFFYRDLESNLSFPSFDIMSDEVRDFIRNDLVPIFFQEEGSESWIRQQTLKARELIDFAMVLLRKLGTRVQPSSPPNPKMVAFMRDIASSIVALSRFFPSVLLSWFSVWFPSGVFSECESELFDALYFIICEMDVSESIAMTAFHTLELILSKMNSGPSVDVRRTIVRIMERIHDESVTVPMEASSKVSTLLDTIARLSQDDGGLPQQILEISTFEKFFVREGGDSDRAWLRFVVIRSSKDQFQRCYSTLIRAVYREIDLRRPGVIPTLRLLKYRVPEHVWTFPAEDARNFLYSWCSSLWPAPPAVCLLADLFENLLRDEKDGIHIVTMLLNSYVLPQLKVAWDGRVAIDALIGVCRIVALVWRGYSSGQVIIGEARQEFLEFFRRVSEDVWEVLYDVVLTPFEFLHPLFEFSESSVENAITQCCSDQLKQQIIGVRYLIAAIQAKKEGVVREILQSADVVERLVAFASSLYSESIRRIDDLTRRLAAFVLMNSLVLGYFPDSSLHLVKDILFMRTDLLDAYRESLLSSNKGVPVTKDFLQVLLRLLETPSLRSHYDAEASKDEEVPVLSMLFSQWMEWCDDLEALRMVASVH